MLFNLSKLKSVVKIFLPYELRQVLRKIQFRLFSQPQKRKYFSINQLDRKLEKYLNFRNGFFVELGANDGKKQSNTLHFELTKDWLGVLIEPSPHNYLKCRANRNSNNHIFCNACVSFGYKEKYVDMRYANLMTISENLNLDLADADRHLQEAKRFLKKYEDEFSFGAVAISLSELLDKAKAPRKIDLLSLDVEGAEFDVLNGIDFSKYKFRYMLIEVRNLSRIETYLQKYGYRLIDKLSTHDYLFSYNDW